MNHHALDANPHTRAPFSRLPHHELCAYRVGAGDVALTLRALPTRGRDVPPHHIELAVRLLDGMGAGSRYPPSRAMAQA